MAHTSLLYMALSSRSRIASSQLAEVRGSTYKCHHRKSKGSYTTDVRSADLKATLKRKKYNRRTRLWRMKQDGGMRVVEFVFTYACVAQLAGALGSYPSGWRFDPARRYHLTFLKIFVIIYIESKEILL